MTEIKPLPISESVRVNRRRIKELMLRLGEQAAQDMICSAQDEIAASLDAIQQAMADRDYPSALQQSERIEDLGWQIGLPSLAGVARNLRDCLLRRNETASAAVGTRLLRVGQLSLMKVRQLREPG